MNSSIRLQMQPERGAGLRLTYTGQICSGNTRHTCIYYDDYLHE